MGDFIMNAGNREFFNECRKWRFFLMDAGNGGFNNGCWKWVIL